MDQCGVGLVGKWLPQSISCIHYEHSPGNRLGYRNNSGRPARWIKLIIFPLRVSLPSQGSHWRQAYLQCSSHCSGIILNPIRVKLPLDCSLKLLSVFLSLHQTLNVVSVPKFNLLKQFHSLNGLFNSPLTIQPFYCPSLQEQKVSKVRI